MAEIISKVSKKIKNVANTTSQKTKSAANIAKYAVKMKSLNHDLRVMYEKLGAAYYANIMLDENNDEQIATRVSEINEVRLEIDRLAKEIKKEKAEFSKKKDGPIEAEFQVIDDDADDVDNNAESSIENSALDTTDE